MTVVFAGAFAAVLFVCLLNWRLGLLLCIAVGFLQDPLRKIVPGRPVTFVIAVAIGFATCVLGLYLRGRQLPLGRLIRYFPGLRVPAIAFTLVVLVQSAMTYSYTGNGVLAGLGLLAYFSPLLALLMGVQFAESGERVRLWLWIYALGAVAAGGSVLAQFSGFRTPLFASIGLDDVYGVGGMIRMLSGLMRSSEIAAWHAAAGACLLTVFGFSARRPIVRRLAFSGVAMMLVVIVLTGRRKMLAELVLFAPIFVAFVTRHGLATSRLLKRALVGALVASIGFQLFSTADSEEALNPYLVRGGSFFADSAGRLRDMTIGSLEWVIAQNGYLGSGAGTAAQGSQYFGGGVAIVGGAAEGGIGKVLAELGLPGLLALLWLGLALSKALLRVARMARRRPPQEALLLYGLIAFLPANGAVFLTAHQVYGDPFILIVLGWMTGSVLAYPRLVMLDTLRRARIEPMTKLDQRRAA